MDKLLHSRLLHDITVFQVTGSDLYGDVAYDAGLPLKAYRHGKLETITSFEGTEVVSNKQYICDGIIEVSEGSVIDDRGERLPIKAIANFDGLRMGTGTTVFYL